VVQSLQCSVLTADILVHRMKSVAEQAMLKLGNINSTVERQNKYSVTEWRPNQSKDKQRSVVVEY